MSTDKVTDSSIRLQYCKTWWRRFKSTNL